MRLLKDVYLVGSGRNGLCLTDDYDCHVYLIDGGDEAALIDVGVGGGMEATLKLIEADGIDQRRIKYVLLTHAHSDHAGAAQQYYERLGCQVMVGEGEAACLQNGDEIAAGLDVAKRVGYYPMSYVYRACPSAIPLSHGQQVKVGDCRLQVISTPGHSKGSICFFMERPDGRVLFSGDVIQFGDFGRFKGMISILNAPGCDLADYAASIARLSDLNVDALLPGHRLFCLKKGQRQIDHVVKTFGGMLLPKSVLQAPS